MNIKIGNVVHGAMTGKYLGVVIAVYGENANVVRVAADAVTARNARDMHTFALVISEPAKAYATYAPHPTSGVVCEVESTATKQFAIFRHEGTMDQLYYAAERAAKNMGCRLESLVAGKAVAA